MPSNPVPNLSQRDLRTLKRLLDAYERHIYGEQALAAQVVRMVAQWVDEDIDPTATRAPYVVRRGL